MGNIWNDFGLNSIKRCNSKSNKPQNIVPPITPENFEIPKGYPAIMWNHIDNRVLISSWNILHFETVTLYLNQFAYLWNPRHAWSFLYFSSAIEDMIMQKCKLQFDQNKRINSKHSTLKPPSLTACSSCRLCPGPGNKDKCKFVLFSNCQIINLSWKDHKKITILTMLRLSVSMGNGNTMVELCSVDMALSVCNNHNNDNHLIFTIIIFY